MTTRNGAVFYATSEATVAASAQAATGGFFWLINPVGATIRIALKSVRFTQSASTVLATPTAPRVTVELVTFTGTSTGTLVNPAKRVSTQAANTGLFVSTSTGLTLTAGNAIHAFIVGAVLTAVGIDNPAELQEFRAEDIDQDIILQAGEGIVIRQPDAGTTGDTREFIINIVWEEF